MTDRNLVPVVPENIPRKKLTNMHDLGISMHMRTTRNVDDQLLEKASILTGIKEKTSLVKLGLEALIARESSKHLAMLGVQKKS